MKKVVFKRIIWISIAVVIVLLSCIFIFKRDFDSTVNKASKNLNTYTIDATLDKDMKITANARVEINKDYASGNEYVFFNLYPRAFREDAKIRPYTNLNQGKCFSNGQSFGNLEVSSVKVNGVSQDVVYDGEDENALKVKRDETSSKNIIELDFATSLPNCNHRLGFMGDNINLGNWYPVLATIKDGEFEISPYYEIGDPFCSDVANYFVNFSFPEEYNPAHTGKMLSLERGKTNHLKVEAKAVRDFAMVLSKKFEVQEIQLKNTCVKYYGYMGDSNLNFAAELAKEALMFFNAKFGEYPYRDLCVVKSPFLFGGMEYPGLVIVADNIESSDDLAKVIVHEIAHQWWYGVVGNNEITEAWLDESLTEYSSLLFFENNSKYNMSYENLVEDAKNTYELYIDVITSLGGTVDTRMNDRVNNYSSEYEYSYLIYVKGVVMLDDIRTEIGEKKMYKALQKYYKQNKFKIASSEDLLQSFRKVAGDKATSKFNNYLNGEKRTKTLN